MRTGASRNPLTAAGWSGLSFTVAGAVGLLISLILARLLEPEDFGLFTEAALVYSGLILLAEGAVVQAIVQARGETERLARAALWLVMGLSLAGAGACVAAGPVMVMFFGDAILAPLLAVLAVGIVISALGAVPHALLSRDLDFRRKTLPETLAEILGGLAALGAAVAGLGVYSLAVWALGRSLVSTVTAWWVLRERPRWDAPDVAALRRLVSSTVNIGGGRLALYVRLNADYLLTGRLLGERALGVYSVAWATSSVPLLVIEAFAGRVGFAVYSRLQDHHERLKSVFLSALRIQAAAGFPVMAGAVLVAPDLLRATLPPKWWPATVPLMILFVLQIIRTVAGEGASIMLAMGRTRLYALIGIAALPATVAGLLIGTRGGVTGVAVAMLTAVGGVSLLYLVVAMRMLQVRVRELVDTLAIPAALTAAALPAIGGTRALLLWAWDAPAVVRLAASIAAGLLACAAVGWSLWPALREDFLRVRRAMPESGAPASVAEPA